MEQTIESRSNMSLKHGRNQQVHGNSGERPLTQEDVDKLNHWHRTDYDRAMTSQEKCYGCTGIASCPNQRQGFYEEAFMCRGNFYWRVVACDYSERQANIKKQARLIKSSHIPDQFVNDTFTDYELTTANMKAVEASKYIVSKPEDTKGLLLYGGVGTGKTKLASIIANAKLEQGAQVLFATVPALLNDMRNSIKSGNLEQVIKTVETAQILVLDDLGSERMTEWVGERLFSLIDYRKNKKLQTIVTTNRSPQQLERYLSIYDKDGNVDDLQGKRVVGRLREMCYFIKLDGPDYRKKVV